MRCPIFGVPTVFHKKSQNLKVGYYNSLLSIGILRLWLNYAIDVRYWVRFFFEVLQDDFDDDYKCGHTLDDFGDTVL